MGDPNESDDWIISKMRNHLRFLACEVRDQLRLSNRLPKGISRPFEIIGDLDHWHGWVIVNHADRLTPSQRALIDALREYVGALYEVCEDDRWARIWFDEGFEDAQEWRDIRDLAGRALDAFGWSFEPPTSYDDPLGMTFRTLDLPDATTEVP